MLNRNFPMFKGEQHQRRFQRVFFRPQKVSGKDFNGVTVLVKKFGKLVDMVFNNSSILTEEYHES